MLFHALALALVATTPVFPEAATPIRAGLVIDRNTTLRRGTYRIPSAGLEAPVITVRGSNIDLDLSGVELVGSPDSAAPDKYQGLAILIDGGEHVSIRNARIRGFKVGIHARNVKDLRIEGNDVSRNWKQRLYSRVEKESLVDWMSYHQNEKDEWLRYGAGIYLAGIDGGRIDRNIARRGQNGLMITRSRNLTISNNDFSFLSSLGIGLYRVTDSKVMHNRIDWCVRGYSHGFYNRGQDSAGLLMYEQSSRNVVAYNSITHGGDGLFLWAGQSTMDTGQGGSNDNLFYGNDFSHAPTNGIEATFSRNRFINNRVEENWHGVWGGYSFDSVIAGNMFARNQEAIAIEHGQNNIIASNTFSGDGIGIRLWANETQDPTWGYAKNRDTRSRDYAITANTMTGVKTPAQITRTENAVIDGPVAAPALPVAPERMSDGIDALLPPGARRGREFIIVDEWGPYDWTTPKLWPAGRSDESPLKLRVLGPPQKWTLRSVRGATASARSGSIPGEITVTPGNRRVVDFTVTLRDAAGRDFSYSRFFAPIDWRLRFFDTSGAKAPVPDMAIISAQKPILETTSDRIDYLSGRAIAPGLPNDHLAMTGEGVVDLPKGRFVLRTISDDGIRVWVDGKLVIDRFDVHESVVAEASIDGGRHTLRVEYFEFVSWAELRVEIVKP
ncbi:MAG: right-handed parallel beta-helix repeat-containing protein [Vicinamibacteria bacterium]|nr:right-handed parallel beta-helix repeat-containing protein [Vicinamibacteria bacterium]